MGTLAQQEQPEDKKKQKLDKEVIKAIKSDKEKAVANNETIKK